MGSKQSKTRKNAESRGIDVEAGFGFLTSGAEFSSSFSSEEEEKEEKLIRSLKSPICHVAVEIDKDYCRSESGSDDLEDVMVLGNTFDTFDSTQVPSEFCTSSDVDYDSCTDSDVDSDVQDLQNSSSESMDSARSMVTSEYDDKLILNEKERQLMESSNSRIRIRIPTSSERVPFNDSVLANLNLGQMDPETFQKAIKEIQNPREKFLEYLNENNMDLGPITNRPDEEGYLDLLDQDYGGAPIVPGPSKIPTIEDYYEHAHTGQIRNSGYEMKSRTEMADGTVKLEFQGPEENRVEDFWTELVANRVKLIVMFGRFVENRAPNCGRYIPKDTRDEHRCGDVIVTRLSRPKVRYGHCRVQKLAVRHLALPESHGWYTVWHCQREYQGDRDYGRQDEEFEALKLEYLAEKNSNVYAVHGPMEFSPLLIPDISEDDYRNQRRRRRK